MSLFKTVMNDTNVLLPTKRGSVIGWSVYSDGEYFFCCAVLDYGNNREELVWHVAGTNKAYSFDEIIELTPNWQILANMEDKTPIVLKRYGKYEKELLKEIEALEDELNTEINLLRWKENQSPKMSTSSNKRKINRMKRKLSMLRNDLDELLQKGK